MRTNNGWQQQREVVVACQLAHSDKVIMKENRIYAARLIIVFGAALAALPACRRGSSSSGALSPAAKAVRVAKADPDPACEELSTVEGTSFWGKKNDAKNEMRENAAKEGANYIRIEALETRGGRVTYSGTAYRCPPSTVLSPEPEPAEESEE